MPALTMLSGLALIAFGLYVISKANRVVALGITLLLCLHQAIRLSRNTTRARIDRVFRCYNEIRIANIARQNLNKPTFDETEVLRRTTAYYAKRQGWARLKIKTFQVSFMDTEGAVRITNIKDLAYALLAYEVREERMDAWLDRNFPLDGENWNYLVERYERFNDAAQKRDSAT